MKVLVNSSDTGGCGQFRIIQPYLQIKSEIEFHLNTTGKIMPEVAFQYDAVVFQRPTESEMIPFIKELKEEGVITVIEIDDDLFSLEKINPSYRFYTKEKLLTFRTILEAADYIHVSTPQLKNRIGLPEKTAIFLNAIDLKKYGNKAEIKKAVKEKYNITAEKTVMWSGGINHIDSLEILVPVIKQLMREKITVVMNCSRDWLNALGFIESEYLKIIPDVPFDEYHNILSIADIGLCPLPNTTFNRSKSELKCIQYGAWGIPTICSPVAPFERFNRLGGANIIVKNDKQKTWMHEIHALLNNNDMYNFMSLGCRFVVEDYYNLETVNKKRADWWEKVLIKKLSSELA